jgi:undecaprenyl-phosphate 4-deoxy-4-formamido-L-arabinose transferase
MIRRLSLVIPVYRGAATIGPLVTRLRTELQDRYDLELVLVNDGSPDDSGTVCRELAAADARVRFLDLARNFGEHNAVLAGLNHCTGEAAVILDDDFQNPPSEVQKLVAAIDAGHDVAWASYEQKQHHWFRNLGSRFNDRMATWMLGKPPDLYLASFKALSRFTIDQVIRYTGPYPYVDGLILRVTRRYTTVPCHHDARQQGKSGYTLRKLVSLWLNMFTTFSVRPLRMASVAGMLIACLGAVLAVAFLLERLYYPDLERGWASLMVTILMLTGSQLMVLGLIGEYLGRLYMHESGQPQFVVRERVNCGEVHSGANAANAGAAGKQGAADVVVRR